MQCACASRAGFYKWFGPVSLTLVVVAVVIPGPNSSFSRTPKLLRQRVKQLATTKARASTDLATNLRFALSQESRRGFFGAPPARIEIWIASELSAWQMTSDRLPFSGP